ncbi:protein twisted gastrulation-like [Calliphora vicina]|uniref:protein twisted gastrulation-like n=1 Tax=Calliphora vicina TaxID=7373 RepID=UPI00325AA9F3
MCLKVYTILNILLILNLVYKYTAASCNEDICGSIVSKCTLTQSCNCEQKDVTCYKECVQCMGKKYFEDCCGCVDLCPKTIDVKTSLSQKSHVEDFEGVPELFDELVSSPADDLGYSWNIFTFPVNYETVLSGFNLKTNEIYSGHTDKETDANLTVNCTVVYLDQCVSWNKCRQSCRSTGASSYRWFHDGCCECVGSTCLNYGVNESRCKFCPEADDEEEFDEAYDDFEDDGSYEFEIFDGNLKDNTI